MDKQDLKEELIKHINILDALTQNMDISHSDRIRVLISKTDTLKALVLLEVNKQQAIGSEPGKKLLQVLERMKPEDIQ